ncbi:MAG: hypothetical protein JXK50_07090 [Campylobacterales bacterium]|nr:hypothetical protein [Campylobacterales bacterium]
MSRKTPIPLSKAPLLSNFLQKIIAFSGQFDIRYNLENQLFITERCSCTQKDCATVYLKRDTPWEDDILGSYIIDTSKGLVILHLEENGRLKIESLLYNFFPYRHEIMRIFSKDFTPPSQKEKDALNRYFKDLKFGTMKTITIDA